MSRTNEMAELVVSLVGRQRGTIPPPPPPPPLPPLHKVHMETAIHSAPLPSVPATAPLALLLKVYYACANNIEVFFLRRMALAKVVTILVAGSKGGFCFPPPLTLPVRYVDARYQ